MLKLYTRILDIQNNTNTPQVNEHGRIKNMISEYIYPCNSAFTVCRFRFLDFFKSYKLYLIL